MFLLLCLVILLAPSLGPSPQGSGHFSLTFGSKRKHISNRQVFLLPGFYQPLFLSARLASPAPPPLHLMASRGGLGDGVTRSRGGRPLRRWGPSRLRASRTRQMSPFKPLIPVALCPQA